MAMLRSAILLLILTTGSGAWAEERLGKDYSDDQLVAMLQDEGFRKVKIVEPTVIEIAIDGIEYYLFVYDDGDLQLWFGLTDYDVNIEDMNEWNRTRRLTRAYIDDENDPILEADLLANAGYTAKQLSEWVSVFDGISRAFRDYVAERDRINSQAAKRRTRERGT